MTRMFRRNLRSGDSRSILRGHHTGVHKPIGKTDLINTIQHRRRGHSESFRESGIPWYHSVGATNPNQPQRRNMTACKKLVSGGITAGPYPPNLLGSNYLYRKIGLRNSTGRNPLTNQHTLIKPWQAPTEIYTLWQTSLVCPIKSVDRQSIGRVPLVRKRRKPKSK